MNELNLVSGEKLDLDLIKESVTIRKSDVEKLGKELMKEIDEFLHDEYIFTSFPEMNLDKEKFDESVNIFKDKYKSGSLSLREMYCILSGINLDDEIHGDLYYKKESFLDLFKVLFSSYSYLED